MSVISALHFACKVLSQIYVTNYKYSIIELGDSIDGTVYHYRDANGLECDAVIHLRNGLYGLIEIKLGGDKLINEGVENLKSMYNKIDIEKMNKPSFLMVLTATGNYAYRREDGVYIVPIGCLKN